VTTVGDHVYLSCMYW